MSRFEYQEMLWKAQKSTDAQCKLSGITIKLFAAKGNPSVRFIL
jgi:hypothetical protein